MSRAYPDRPIVGIGVVVWRDDRVLLIRRGKPPRKGEWSLPGGAQELGETLIEAALREVYEETGLRAQQPSLVTALDMIDRDDQGKIRHHYTLIDFSAEAPDGIAESGDDAIDTAWFTLAEIETLPLWQESKRIIKLAASKRPTPA